MKSSGKFIPLTILLLIIYSFLSCRKNLKSNEFTIYVSGNNPGWHFVDLTYDTIHKGFHRVNVKFNKGQMFQFAKIRSDLINYPVGFLYNNGDTLKSGLWFAGTDIYNEDSLQGKFICFYMPSELQRKTIKDYMKDPIYDKLRYEKDSILRNYLLQRNQSR